MANTFIPFDLVIKDLSTASVLIQWELDNTVEFKTGTYYNLYTSNDGTTFTFLKSSKVIESIK